MKFNPMKKILYLLCSAGILSACSGTGESSTESSTASSTESSNVISQCLAAKDYQYEELLTKADIAKYVSIDESSYKQKVSSTKGKYGSCVYSWTSERPEKEIISKATGTIYKRPDMNQVTIKMLDFYEDSDLKLHEQETAIDLFDQGYKKLSQTEYDELLANFEKKLGDKPKDLAQAKKMMDARMKFNYEPVADLGDRAYWKWHDDYGIELVVLTGTARFTILSKITGEPETSLNHAVDFAKEVLAKCAG